MTQQIEAQIQKAIVEYCDWKAPSDWRYSLLVHTANQGPRSARFGAELKRMGLRPGFPDLSFYWPNRGRLLFIELKAPGGKLRANQKHWLETLRRAGHVAVVVESTDEGIRSIESHLRKDEA